MILADTSIWVDHFRRANRLLAERLELREVLTHPFVIGELALGNLRRRDVIIQSLRDLPQATIASHEELLTFIEEATLPGAGIGYVDAHLLASTRLTTGASLWTRDTRLHHVALRLGLSPRS